MDLFHTLGYDMRLFGYDMILFGSSFNFQEPLVMLVAGLISFGVTNQVPQVFFKLVARDLMLVSSYEFDDIIFCESLIIFKLYQIMELKHSLSTVSGLLYLSI